MQILYQKMAVKVSKLKEIVFLLTLVTFTIVGVNSVKDNGFQNTKSSEIMGSIQFGISNIIGKSPDFAAIAPRNGNMDKDIQRYFDGESTAANKLSNFTFTIYSYKTFNYIRKISGINNSDFVPSLCQLPLKKIGSAGGGSGALFYKTGDGKFFIKTVKKKELRFLQQSLPLLTKHFRENPNTLLTKYFGLYGYKRYFGEKRFIVMNNILPTGLKIHEIYDLKGATFNRNVPKSEKEKESPTYRDNDFTSNYPNGIYVSYKVHTALSQRIKKDCEFLKYINATDYSFLIGIHNYNLVNIQKLYFQETNSVDQKLLELFRSVQHGNNIQSISDGIPQGGIPGINSNRDKLLIYCGIMDILMRYGKRKNVERIFRVSLFGSDIAIQKPDYYAERFYNFITQQAFTPLGF